MLFVNHLNIKYDHPKRSFDKGREAKKGEDGSSGLHFKKTNPHFFKIFNISCSKDSITYSSIRPISFPFL